jgi:hypothetical protein
LRQGWDRFLRAQDEPAKLHQFAELSNVIEIACALCVKKVFIGIPRELLTEYLDDVMRLLDANDDAKGRLETLIHSETTFKYIVRYLKMRRKLGILR